MLAQLKRVAWALTPLNKYRHVHCFWLKHLWLFVKTLHSKNYFTNFFVCVVLGFEFRVSANQGRNSTTWAAPPSPINFLLFLERWICLCPNLLCQTFENNSFMVLSCPNDPYQNYYSLWLYLACFLHRDTVWLNIKH